MSIEQKDEKWIASCEREDCGWTKQYEKDYLANRGLNAHKSAHQPARAPTPTLQAVEPAPLLADERGNLQQYITECWPSPQAKQKVAGVLRNMELKGWNNLDALQWALVKAGCGAGDVELILDNWRTYMTRSGQKVEEPKQATTEIPNIGEGGAPDDDVEREVNRVTKLKARKALLRELDGNDDGGSKLAEEIRKLREDLTRKEEEDKHQRELTALRAQIAATQTRLTSTNVRTVRHPVLDANSHPVTDVDGNPVYTLIEEPWTPAREPVDVGKTVADAVDKAVGGAVNAIKPLIDAAKPHEDPRLASVEAELKALRQQQEDKRLEEVVDKATGPLYAMIRQHDTERSVTDQLTAKLKEMGIAGSTKSPEVEAEIKVIEGGFSTLNQTLHGMQKRLDTVQHAVIPVAQAVGRAVERELSGPRVERTPEQMEADLQMGERAATGEPPPPVDIPPIESPVHSSPPPQEEPPARVQPPSRGKHLEL